MSDDSCPKCGHERAYHDRLLLVKTPNGWWPTPSLDRGCKDGCTCQEINRPTDHDEERGL